VTIVQGRYDVVCPPVTAWDLHKAWPESKLHWISDAGHSATVSFVAVYVEPMANTYQEPGTKKKLIEACDEYAGLEL
jgi:proline iminopeptidase